MYTSGDGKKWRIFFLNFSLQVRTHRAGIKTYDENDQTNTFFKQLELKIELNF